MAWLLFFAPSSSPLPPVHMFAAQEVVGDVYAELFRVDLNPAVDAAAAIA